MTKGHARIPQVSGGREENIMSIEPLGNFFCGFSTAR
jgi:hypothetical protein